MSQVMTNVADLHFRYQLFLGGLVGLDLLMCPFVRGSVLAGDMAKDPNGFYDIARETRIAD
jgi:hypothetical protein